MPLTSAAMTLAVQSHRETVPYTSSTGLPNYLWFCRFRLGVHGPDSGDDVGLGLWIGLRRVVGAFHGLARAVLLFGL